MKHIIQKESRIGKHQIKNALAGTGKTYSLIKIAEEAQSMGLKILYLTYNKKIRFEVIEKSKLDRTQVHTFHSFAYREIIQTDYLKDVIQDYSPEELSQYFNQDYQYFSSKLKSGSCPEISKNTLNNLLSWWSDHSDHSKRTSYDLIIVDEFQDLNTSMFRMLKKLYMINKKNSVKLIVAGDPYQNIYYHLNEGKAENYFKSFEKYFGGYEESDLNICHRCSASIQEFANGFYKKQYKNYRQFDLSRYKSSDFTEDVFIYAIQHKKLLEDKVREIVGQYPGKTIKIMGRVNKELNPLLCLASDNELVSISSIHSEKGNECDVAIIVNTKFNDKILSEADKNLWNVAITRAKEKVYIVTSFPQAIITGLFEKGTFTLISDQKKLSISTEPIISDKPINLTIGIVQKSLIDSIDIQLPEEEAPFIPYEQQNLKKKSPYMTDTKMTLNNLYFVLHRLKGKLNFDFTDLSQLKNQGLTDLQIVSYILDVQKEYFDKSISQEQLLNQKVRKLDLAKYIEVSSQKILDYLSLIMKLSKYSDGSNKTYCYENEEGQRTIYLNPLRSRKRGIRIYFPQFKKINPLNTDKTFLKVELYRVRESHKKNTDTINFTVRELLEIIEKNELEKLYYEWMEFEFSFLKEKEVKNVEMLKERRNIKSFNDLKVIIDKGDLEPKDKRIYFYILLSLLNKVEMDEIMSVFPSLKKVL